MFFFRFSKKSGFGVFLFHPTVVSVLLSASVERCFVSRMRGFLFILLEPYSKSFFCFRTSHLHTTVWDQTFQDPPNIKDLVYLQSHLLHFYYTFLHNFSIIRSNLAEFSTYTPRSLQLSTSYILYSIYPLK